MVTGLKAGDLLQIDRTASVQFLTPFRIRLIKVLTDRITYDGWVWLEAYQLDDRDEAVARRELFVRKEGLRLLVEPPPQRRPAAPRRRANQAAHRRRQPDTSRKPSSTPGQPT
ncbi:hypothetical protein [Micromonospora sp. D93]|uniref:hypothetical protein n=1 Tax=Micromonospora sp. D93 TaxID=2824886 RepID=UPI001FFCB788|nr:hypothetical protein [Micromonospora sp. D93]